ncbi:DEAD/DEAH box helicase [bacterium]|nr:DEAD/DEAH box helicase [bacterium]
MPEKMSELIRYGLSAQVIATLESAFGPDLLPLQQQVLEQTGLLDRNESLLVCAPTASGKTLVAELAALNQLTRSRLVLFLVPTRALAEEKAAEFAERYGPLGIRVACTTRDRREHDRDILKGRIHLVVAVYEKALALLGRQASMLGRIGLIVADEVQLLGDGERGAAIDLFLTRWKLAPERPQLLALSAVLGNAEALAATWGIGLVRSEVRPVPLREGVLDVQTGVFHWREAHGGQSGTEDLIQPVADDSVPAETRAAKAMIRLARAAGPVLRFCTTRREAECLAQELAREEAFPPAESALAELSTTERQLSRDRLEELLAHGIGLHTGDMPAPHRRLVEAAFNDGAIAILVATPTLDQGVNLTAATVVQSPYMIERNAFARSSTAVPLSRGRFLNQGGRAGRRGCDFGRSMILVEGEFAREQAWRTFITPRIEPVESPLGAGPLTNAVAELLREGRASTQEGLLAFLMASAGGQLRGPDIIRGRLARAIEEGAQWGLWREDSANQLPLTALGEALASGGIQPETLVRWVEVLRHTDKQHGLSDLLFFLMLANEWKDVPFTVTWSDWRHNVWPTGLVDQFGSGGLGRHLRAMFETESGAPFSHHQACRRTMVMLDWLAGDAIGEIEDFHGIPAGQIIRIAATTSWLATAAADTAGAVGAPEELIKGFEDLAAGLGENMRLAEAGERLHRKEPPAAQPASAEHTPRLVFPSESPGHVEFDGRRIALTPTQYTLLRLLAGRAGNAVSYIEIEQTLWPDAAVERQQVFHHRRAVDKALCPAGGGLIATRHGWGLLLKLSEADVLVEEAGEQRLAV